MLAERQTPPELAQQFEAWAGCVAGAATLDETASMLREAGFIDIDVERVQASRAFIAESLPGSGVENYVVSAKVQARKPEA